MVRAVMLMMWPLAGRRRVLFASALDFRPFLRLSPPLLVCLTFLRTRPHAIGSLLGFVRVAVRMKLKFELLESTG